MTKSSPWEANCKKTNNTSLLPKKRLLPQMPNDVDSAGCHTLAGLRRKPFASAMVTSHQYLLIYRKFANKPTQQPSLTSKHWRMKLVEASNQLAKRKTLPTAFVEDRNVSVYRSKEFSPTFFWIADCACQSWPAAFWKIAFNRTYTIELTWPRSLVHRIVLLGAVSLQRTHIHTQQNSCPPIANSNSAPSHRSERPQEKQERHAGWAWV